MRELDQQVVRGADRIKVRESNWRDKRGSDRRYGNGTDMREFGGSYMTEVRVYHIRDLRGLVREYDMK